MEINETELFSPAISLNRIDSFRAQALPPSYQRLREIQAILNDPRLIEALGSSDPIERIEKNLQGYRIFTEHYELQVLVYVIHDDNRCGPGHIELEFCQPTPRRM